MENNILQFDNSAKKYLALAEKKLTNESYLDGLSYLFSALRQDYCSEILSKIANTYFEMELYELSNKYWIKFLDVAKEKDYGIAYENMGVNFFYQDNFVLAGYYFDKKVSKYGLIQAENLREEVIDFFSGAFDKKNLFRIVYPFNLADFSDNVRLAKSLMANGDFRKAIEVLKKVPKGTADYFDAQDEISLAKFLTGDVDQAIDINRQLLKEVGDNVSCFCNLSSFYIFKGDKEKSRFYYDKAISIDNVEEEDNYKLATCSLEQGEHLRAIKHLDIILKDKPYEINLKYLLGLALINANFLERACVTFRELCNIEPDNAVYRFYLKMASSLSNGEKLYQKRLPVIYDEDLPRWEINSRRQVIKKYFDLTSVSFNKKIATEEFYFNCRWAFCSGDEECTKILAFLLSASANGRTYEILFDILTDIGVKESVKAEALFTLIVQGVKGKIGVCCGNFFNKIKISQLEFENDEKCEELFFAYAILLTKLAFMDIQNFDKIAFCANKIYKKLKNKEEFYDFKKDELASLILYLCNYVRFKNESDILRLLNVKKARFELLLQLYNGEKDD